MDKEKIAGKHSIIKGFSIVSNPDVIEENLYKAIDEYLLEFAIFYDETERAGDQRTAQEALQQFKDKTI